MDCNQTVDDGESTIGQMHLKTTLICATDIGVEIAEV